MTKIEKKKRREEIKDFNFAPECSIGFTYTIYNKLMIDLVVYM
jgi:hypothetical protein